MGVGSGAAWVGTLLTRQDSLAPRTRVGLGDKPEQCTTVEWGLSGLQWERTG